MEYRFTSRLPETVTAKQKSELVLECSLSDEKPGVVWSNNGVVIEVRTFTVCFIIIIYELMCIN